MKYIYIFLLGSILTIPQLTVTTTPKTKGNIVQQGETLDLSTFTKTASGLQYKILSPAAESAASPVAGEKVNAHYTGWLLQGNTIGSKFDSSKDRGQPFTLPVGLGYVIKGWEEALLSMKVGEKRLLVIPPNLGYGAQSVGNVIPANATLVFEIELLEILG